MFKNHRLGKTMWYLLLITGLVVGATPLCQSPASAEPIPQCLCCNVDADCKADYLECHISGSPCTGGEFAGCCARKDVGGH